MHYLIWQKQKSPATAAIEIPLQDRFVPSWFGEMQQQEELISSTLTLQVITSEHSAETITGREMFPFNTSHRNKTKKQIFKS